MKNKRIVKILIFVIAIIGLSITKSYAAVEVKDSASVLTNKTISEFYDMAKEMKNPGQGLEGTNVDVKMANNYEWATVSYFANSSYGYGNETSVVANKGVSITTDVTSHYSTNGNLTGIMDWGSNPRSTMYTFTAGIITSYASKELTTSGGQSIINAAGTDNVDKFIASGGNNDFAIAKTNWTGVSWKYAGDSKDYPYSVREGLFGFGGGYYGNFTGRPCGAAYSDVTFRPVFYAN